MDLVLIGLELIGLELIGLELIGLELIGRCYLGVHLRELRRDMDRLNSYIVARQQTLMLNGSGLDGILTG